MRHRKTTKTLDRTSAQRRPLLMNLATALIVHEKIITTNARAKVTRSLVEKLITLGKKNSIHHRRQLTKILTRPLAVNKVLTVLGPRFQTRPGGYTRLTKMAPRRGDGAAQVLVEILA